MNYKGKEIDFDRFMEHLREDNFDLWFELDDYIRETMDIIAEVREENGNLTASIEEMWSPEDVDEEVAEAKAEVKNDIEEAIEESHREFEEKVKRLNEAIEGLKKEVKHACIGE